jgi:glycosyltransferase involved in cell wall biosynthesis
LNLAVKYISYAALPWISRPFNGQSCAHHLEQHIRDFAPDVILNYWLYPAGYGAVSVGRKLGVPVIVGSIGSDLNAIGDPISRWLTRRTLKSASLVITKSQHLRQQALAMGTADNKIRVVPNGCDSTVFVVRSRNEARAELNIPSAAEIIVFVGRMHRSKGIFELLDAFIELSATYPNARLVYIGDGSELSSLKLKSNAASPPVNVQFAGARFPSEVARWIAAANLLALPSYAEGCPNVIIEALCCGRPVVAANVGGIPELVDSSCGLLIPPRQVPALRDALNAVLTSSWDEHQIGSRCGRSWEQVAREVLALCESLLQNPKQVSQQLKCAVAVPLGPRDC